ncbi:polysaccharide biosynthesis protein [Sphingomonas hylomeconis]|uniref:Polysaccharide biosynthesis protein n=1 Tax=Sphingomonas hylomeconis TaxID=1395958 RepID=A0ABV7SVI2_9SPHN|nr:nucleoside-diphosphate sugar epimerase/dehydratase [Sphingomonas hylomeconis]
MSILERALAGRNLIGRRRVTMAIDVLLACMAEYLTLVVLFRYDRLEFILPLVAGAGIAGTLALYAVQAHRQTWSRVSLNDLMALAIASAIVSPIVSILAWIFVNGTTAPRVLIGTFVMLLCAWSAPRLLIRLYFESKSRPVRTGKDETVLLYGSGRRAENFIRYNNESGTYRIAGLLHENPGLEGRKIRGVAALGRLDQLDMVLDKLLDHGIKPQRLIVTEDRERPDELSIALDAAARNGLRLARLSSVLSLVERGSSDVVRDVSIDEILHREQVVLNDNRVPDTIRNRVVLVTGAGGSIGSELVRQIAGHHPARIVLVEQSEFNLYQIDMEMSVRFPGVERVRALCDVRDLPALRRVFKRERPDIVLHAAALKHVPMLEDQPAQAILTNVLGTFNVASLARDFDVDVFTLISTDKAVNPTNVMGTTKRWAEIICQAFDADRANSRRRTRFACVRFGNVLDSAGSVVPLFRQQIAAGGPLTITHPDITRYFMTIPEACELILTATAATRDTLQSASQVFVLDMGAPVRIMDLAVRMVQLHGLRPHHDIAISITGLRPGEKLYEELAHTEEALVPAPFAKASLAKARACDVATLTDAFGLLLAAVEAGQDEAMIVRLQQLVPEFVRGPVAVPGLAAA